MGWCLTLFTPSILTDPSPTFTFPPNYYSSSKPPNLGVRQQTHRHTHQKKQQQLNCYDNDETPSSSSQSSMDSIEYNNNNNPPQDAILKAISEISKAEGRIGRTSTLILGGTITDDSTYDGISLTKMLNIYPAARGFTAIGSGGDDFVQSMVFAVESVVQHPIPQGKVKQKLSSGGKYVSVNIGPVQIVSSNQVQAVYHAMKRDFRMRYFL
uniref:uncharacterized protein LOC122578793 n=1 Tax=Erigeron canadensis TaxID=72917 RepID=UPI001CB8EA06|nr:uncharacterized protein LOC122578793 [Erigeron canadensis]